MGRKRSFKTPNEILQEKRTSPALQERDDENDYRRPEPHGGEPNDKDFVPDLDKNSLRRLRDDLSKLGVDFEDPKLEGTEYWTFKFKLDDLWDKISERLQIHFNEYDLREVNPKVPQVLRVQFDRLPPRRR